ncbi:hypothetical protein EIK77_006688 [Talaromyces pinophilus]|nr:hypothetical protein EIK77_006688 [Talaromyces pinophilus]
MKLSLWDTAGQETYKSVTRSYFRGASGALLVFDITRPSTFASVTGWLQDLRQIAEEGIVVVLVGNKCDLASNEKFADGQGQGEEGQSKNQRRVTREEAEEWCRQNNVIRYIETSAKSGEGVERAFLEVAERIYRNIEAGSKASKLHDISLIANAPCAKPLQVFPLSVWSLHTKNNVLEDDEQSNYSNIEGYIDGPLNLGAEFSSNPVNAESGCQDSEVERRVIMMNVGDTSHNDEWEVVENPTDRWVDTSVVDLIDFTGTEIHVTTLPTDEVPSEDQAETQKTGSTSPVNEGVP